MQQYQYLAHLKYFWLESASLDFWKIQKFKEQPDYEGLLSAQENQTFTCSPGSRSNEWPARACFLPTESVLDKPLRHPGHSCLIHVFPFQKIASRLQRLFSFFEVWSQLCSTADSFWTYTGDQKSNKQADQILSLLPSCQTHKILPSLQYKGKACPQSTLLLL